MRLRLAGEPVLLQASPDNRSAGRLSSPTIQSTHSRSRITLQWTPPPRAIDSDAPLVAHCQRTSRTDDETCLAGRGVHRVARSPSRLLPGEVIEIRSPHVFVRSFALLAEIRTLSLPVCQQLLSLPVAAFGTEFPIDVFHPDRTTARPMRPIASSRFCTAISHRSVTSELSFRVQIDILRLCPRQPNWPNAPVFPAPLAP